MTLAALSLLTRSFNGLGPDKDGLDIAEEASDVLVKIKTRSHDAAKRLASGGR